MKVVVDTNVPKVANGPNASPQATAQCVLACIRYIDEICAGKHVLVLDDGWHILSEYMQQLRSTGQPGVGDGFLKWVLTNQYNPVHCERVPISSHPERGFREFPEDPRLENFDRSDRKFVAVSRAHASRPPIVNAVDTDWWSYRTVLESHGVSVLFLCPELMR